MRQVRQMIVVVFVGLLVVGSSSLQSAQHPGVAVNIENISEMGQQMKARMEARRLKDIAERDAKNRADKLNGLYRTIAEVLTELHPAQKKLEETKNGTIDVKLAKKVSDLSAKLKNAASELDKLNKPKK